jgi:hypothetical protein
MKASDAVARGKVAKTHKIIEEALWHQESDFIDFISTKVDIFHTFIFVDLDNQHAPRAASAPAGVALICVGKEDSFSKLRHDLSSSLPYFHASGSLFCFACGDYKEAVDDRINFLGIELAKVAKNRGALYIFLSQDRVYSITAEGAESQDRTARTACIYLSRPGSAPFSILDVINGALANLHPRIAIPSMSAWLH